MPLAPPSSIQLKTRGYKGSLITLDGYKTTAVNKDNVGRSLTGTRFSGRRCSVPMLSPSLQLFRELSNLVENGTHSDDNDSENGNEIVQKGEMETHVKIVISPDENSRDYSPIHKPESGSRNLPSNLKLYSSTLAVPSKDESILHDDKRRACCQWRRKSDTFAMELATFRRNREIKMSTGRRLSDFFRLSKARRLSQLMHITTGGLAVGGAVSKWIAKVKKHYTFEPGSEKRPL